MNAYFCPFMNPYQDSGSGQLLYIALSVGLRLRIVVGFSERVPWNVS